MTRGPVALVFSKEVRVSARSARRLASPGAERNNTTSYHLPRAARARWGAAWPFQFQYGSYVASSRVRGSRAARRGASRAGPDQTSTTSRVRRARGGGAAASDRKDGSDIRAVGKTR